MNDRDSLSRMNGLSVVWPRYDFRNHWVTTYIYIPYSKISRVHTYTVYCVYHLTVRKNSTMAARNEAWPGLASCVAKTAACFLEESKTWYTFYVDNKASFTPIQ